MNNIISYRKTIKKFALIVFTPNGYKLAKEIKSSLKDKNCTIFAKKGLYNNCQEFNHLIDSMPQIFNNYSAIIFLGAVGIAVRMIAPFILKKDKDPAVICIDEQGNFVVSVLSGHLGGANDLSLEIAKIINATPVITTATDQNNLFAPDLFARQYHLNVFPIENIKILNSRLLNNQFLNYYIDNDLPKPIQNFYYNELIKHHQKVQIIDRKALPNFSVFITQKVILPSKNCLSLVVPRLHAGIGCRRGTKLIDILEALKIACNSINCSFYHIDSLASTKAKEDEIGLLKLSRQYNLPIDFYSNNYLQDIIDTYHLSTSPFVEKTIGVGNVCESSALSKKGKLILPKTKYKKVTVALTWLNSV